jgi:dTDP-4-dehydrorhamnose reductase
MRPRILVLGGTGMLGQSVLSTFNLNKDFDVNFTSRIPGRGIYSEKLIPDTLDLILNYAPDWIINCVGVIKPYIDDNDSKSTSNAHNVNTVFPLELNIIAERLDARVIQIATDCVYSGKRGNYSEFDVHDPSDFYGVSKSQGEVISDHFMNLRCSIVGRDSRNNMSLLEWFLSQEKNSKITGYLDHLWNGVTTNAFARICIGIIEEDLFKPGRFHQVPADKVSKAELLVMFQNKFNRPDLIIDKRVTGDKIDRTITTIDPAGNLNRWLAAGYRGIPTILDLIEEL